MEVHMHKLLFIVQRYEKAGYFYQFYFKFCD
jgi:hypothetical protein